jgi:hypothetical protein
MSQLGTKQDSSKLQENLWVASKQGWVLQGPFEDILNVILAVWPLGFWSVKSEREVVGQEVIAGSRRGVTKYIYGSKFLCFFFGFSGVWTQGFILLGLSHSASPGPRFLELFLSSLGQVSRTIREVRRELLPLLNYILPTILKNEPLCWHRALDDIV